MTWDTRSKELSQPRQGQQALHLLYILRRKCPKILSPTNWKTNVDFLDEVNKSSCRRSWNQQSVSGCDSHSAPGLNSASSRKTPQHVCLEPGWKRAVLSLPGALPLRSGPWLHHWRGQDKQPVVNEKPGAAAGTPFSNRTLRSGWTRLTDGAKTGPTAPAVVHQETGGIPAMSLSLWREPESVMCWTGAALLPSSARSSMHLLEAMTLLNKVNEVKSFPLKRGHMSCVVLVPPAFLPFHTLAVLLTSSGSSSSQAASVTWVMFSTGLVRVSSTWLSWIHRKEEGKRTDQQGLPCWAGGFHVFPWIALWAPPAQCKAQFHSHVTPGHKLSPQMWHERFSPESPILFITAVISGSEEERTCSWHQGATPTSDQQAFCEAGWPPGNAVYSTCDWTVSVTWLFQVHEQTIMSILLVLLRYQ